MSGILVGLAENNVKLAYLPSLHDLSTHWNAFVSLSCPDVMFPEGFASSPFNTLDPSHNEKETQKDSFGDYASAKKVWSEGGPTAQALCILHVMDYACFDKLEIPQLCKDVYSEKDFARSIMSYRKSTTESEIF